ncbi:MAG: hypothetical protein ACI9OF_002955 [Saprospiraceae bacterium]|jgi:hypothetical protein
MTMMPKAIAAVSGCLPLDTLAPVHGLSTEAPSGHAGHFENHQPVVFMNINTWHGSCAELLSIQIQQDSAAMISPSKHYPVVVKPSTVWNQKCRTYLLCVLISVSVIGTLLMRTAIDTKRNASQPFNLAANNIPLGYPSR